MKEWSSNKLDNFKGVNQNCNHTKPREITQIITDDIIIGNLLQNPTPEISGGGFHYSILENCINKANTEKENLYIDFLMKEGMYYLKAFKIPFEHLKNFETDYLYSFNGYRDHYLHSFRVWGLGRLLYDLFFKNYFPNDSKFYFKWYLAAVYHDIGYPISSLNLIINSLNNYCNGTQISVDVTQCNEPGILNSNIIIEHLTKIGCQKFVKDYLFDESHGLISARLLLHLLEKHLPDHWDKSALESIKSIIIHSQEEVRFQINDDPLSALLIICDEMQEWDRPNIRELNNYHQRILKITIFDEEYKFNFITSTLKSEIPQYNSNLNRIQGISISMST